MTTALTTRAAMGRPGQGGFTLVELMVGMVLSGIVLTFIFIVSGKMSSAYFGQSQVADVQETLRTARGAVAADLRQAGFFVSNGFRTAALGDPTEVVPPLQIVNDASGSGPDLVRIFYADSAAASRVTAIDPVARLFADVDSAAAFSTGEVVVLVNSSIVAATDDTPAQVTYSACLVRVTSIDTGATDRLHFAGAGAAGSPYNTADNAQCTEVATATLAEASEPDTVVYRFVGRSYRIDPDRLALGVLQGSPSGELEEDDWMDLALGITTLQLASRYFEAGDAVDLDGDGDPEWDWYSSDNQETPDSTGDRPLTAVLSEVRASVEARSQRGTRAVPSSRSVAFIDEENVDHNSIGDWAGVQLSGVVDSDRPDGYAGEHIYRAASALIDLRNLGVAQ